MLCLSELFSIQRLETVPAKFELDALIALLRLEGQVPIARISEILRVLGYPHDSNGMVSERLTFFGSCLSNTLNIGMPYLIFYLSDEIFALGCPILVTIDPVSTAILRIELASDRKGDTWKKHFSELLSGTGFKPRPKRFKCSGRSVSLDPWARSQRLLTG